MDGLVENVLEPRTFPSPFTSCNPTLVVDVLGTEILFFSLSTDPGTKKSIDETSAKFLVPSSAKVLELDPPLVKVSIYKKELYCEPLFDTFRSSFF